MDFCDYPKDHFLHSDAHKKCIGYLKDEMNGGNIQEFIGLKPKLYMIVKERIKGCENEEVREDCTKRAKGVKKCVVQNELCYRHYCEAIFNNKFFTHSMKRLQSKNHEIFALEQKKLTVNPLDDKRYILGDHVRTLAYGHHKIEDIQRRAMDDKDSNSCLGQANGTS